MFHIDTTFEDSRFQATSGDGQNWSAKCWDNFSGKCHEIQTISALQISYILAINLHNDGTPEGVDKMYDSLEPLLVNCPQECRPIP